MIKDFEEYVNDIAECVSKELGDILDPSTTRWINRPIGKEQLKDATLAFYVDGKRRTDDVVLLISNFSFPGVVQADVARAREIAMRVSQRVGHHVSTPAHEGKYGTQTYAAFFRLSPLSDFRLVKLLQKYRAARRILPWITELANETREQRETAAEYELYFVDPLVTLCGNKDISTNVRGRANKYLGLVQNRKVDLFTCVEHGDFWIGNVFFERRFFPNINPSLGDFSVIDWRGARLDGYPCIDWARLCLSLFKVGSNRVDELVSAYINALGISAIEFQVYCFLALGKLGDDLDQFPKERYIALCDNVSEFLDTHSR